MNGTGMLRAVFVFVCFTFVYTAFWFLFTPVLDSVLGAFSLISQATWSTQAVSTFNFVIILGSNMWTWVGILSVVSTLVWLIVFPYREEVDTYAVRY
jgi:hypothetical protein